MSYDLRIWSAEPVVLPPPSAGSAGGRPALERFLQENFDDYILWRPNAPVIEVDLALTSRWGSFRDGFRSNYLSVGVDAAVLDQPGGSASYASSGRAEPDMTPKPL